MSDILDDEEAMNAISILLERGYSADDVCAALRMEEEGITNQDIYETMPPRQGDT